MLGSSTSHLSISVIRLDDMARPDHCKSDVLYISRQLLRKGLKTFIMCYSILGKTSTFKETRYERSLLTSHLLGLVRIATGSFSSIRLAKWPYMCDTTYITATSLGSQDGQDAIFLNSFSWLHIDRICWCHVGGSNIRLVYEDR